ncbi:MAG: hypothetical protein AB1441_06175 [Bacillota bacterium]
MNLHAHQVGFSQRVRLEWLEQAANLVLAGNDKSAINNALQELLKDKVSVGGPAVRGNREKIITILMKVWFNVPRELEMFRDDGLDLLRRLPRTDRVAVHWGMVMAVYPFWAAVAGHVGRLLKLQGSAAAAHVQRRMREQYGERETVSRAARRVMRSYVDWGVLSETAAKGVYAPGLSLPVDDAKLVSWLIEAALYARPNGSAALRELFDSTSQFPFRLKQITAENLSTMSPRLEFLRHGLDEDLVILRRWPGANPRFR